MNQCSASSFVRGYLSELSTVKCIYPESSPKEQKSSSSSLLHKSSQNCATLNLSSWMLQHITVQITRHFQWIFGICGIWCKESTNFHNAITFPRSILLRNWHFHWFWPCESTNFCNVITFPSCKNAIFWLFINFM